MSQKPTVFIPLADMNGALRSFVEADRVDLVTAANSGERQKGLLSFPQPYQAGNFDFLLKRSGWRMDWEVCGIDVQGTLIGCIGAHPYKEHWKSHCVLMGYWIHKDYEGLGITSRAVQSMLALIRTRSAYSRVDSSAFSWNKASARVLQKNGFSFEGYERQAIIKDGAFIDLMRFGLLLN